MELAYVLRGLELLRDPLGSQWLDREVGEVLAHRKSDASGGRGPLRKFHPAAELFANVTQQLEASHQLVSPTRDLIRLGLIGQQFALLERANVKGTLQKAKLLRSDNWDLFSSTAFEIEIAALHVQIGRQVEFIRETTETSPDLLVNGEVEVECKSVRQLTQRDENNREMWTQLKRKLWEKGAKSSGFYVEFETKHDVRQEDLAWVVEQFAFAQGRPDHNAQQAGRRVRIVPLKPGVDAAGTSCAAPNDAPPLAAFDLGEIEMTMQVQGTVPTGLGSTYIFAFRTSDPPDWQARVYRLLKHARRQFSKTRPAVIFVELPYGGRESGTSYKMRIASGVRDFMRQSRTVSAVVACFLTVEPLASGEGVRRSYEVERNPAARLPVPSPEVYFSSR